MGTSGTVLLSKVKRPNRGALEKGPEIMAHLQGTKNNGLRDLAEDSPDFSNPTEEMVLQPRGWVSI